MGNLCKLCDQKRFANLSICFKHYKERERKKKEEKNARRLERKLRTKKYQQSELKRWKAKCWKLTSEFVRRSGADWRGMVKCYTCDALLPWKESHCGHHFHGKLDYDLRNLRVQDAACNTYRGGMLNVYARKLIEENGMDWYKKLELDANTHTGYTLEEIKVIYSDLKTKLSLLPKT